VSDLPGEEEWKLRRVSCFLPSTEEERREEKRDTAGIFSLVHGRRREVKGWGIR